MEVGARGEITMEVDMDKENMPLWYLKRVTLEST